MAKLQQSNIEDFAYDYLHIYYAARYHTQNILTSKAERTKKGDAATGLFALKTKGNAAFVAALNARLSGEIARLLTRYKKQGLSKTRLITAFVLFTTLLFSGKTIGYYGVVLYLLPVVAGLTGFILHSLLEKKYLKYRLKRLVDELKKTPADEQWIGISVSSLTFRHNALAAYFVNICKRRGIGVLTVGKRAKVVQLQEPRTVHCRRGDFLSYYRSEDQIRRALGDNTMLRVA
ncbi:hypothetical protein I2I11_11730 [Pontibacter sp. 172403-2]|uniref:hypothetical protein n=1 Tax=Pontibacter rufus TaxID=2791028 RepID=UPI0018AFCA3E|nr:hypothetical protein [Pontibacter sp. 172403-2]MBF9253964.1 hypothetical protein [Pontibacter sp. 172403-2]